MRLYVIRVDITEAATKHAYTIVRHEFIGRTAKEASRYFESHMKTDSFLRGCVNSGKWESVSCRARISEGWVDD